jgi:hypothetical protein
LKTRWSQEMHPPLIDGDTVIIGEGCIPRDEEILLFCTTVDISILYVFGIRGKVPVELSAHHLTDDEKMIVRRMGWVTNKIEYDDDRYYTL